MRTSPPPVPQVMPGIDGRRMDRAVARLGNSDAGLGWLSSIGVGMPFARRAGIGVDGEDDDGIVVVHAARRRDGDRSLARFRVGPDRVIAPFAAGAPTCHWSDPPAHGADLIVAPDLAALWLLDQARGEDGLAPFVAVAPLHGRGLPVEWGDPLFWEAFGSITVVADDAIAAGRLLAVVAGAAGAKASVVTPSSGGTWRAHLGGEGGLGAAALQAIVDDAVPASRWLGEAGGASRADVEVVDPHDLDRRGRLMRLVRVEERAPARLVAGRQVEQVRFRDVVVRSDGMLLDVVRLPAPPGTPAADRIAALSDGTRLERLPPPASQSGWSLGAVRAFVARGGGRPAGEGAEGAGDLVAATGAVLAAVVDDVVAATGLDETAARVAGAFVLLSYVHQGVDELRVPVFAGGRQGDRARLLRSLAQLCHVGVVVGRSRARTLARMVDETGGTLLLDDPGPLAGPMGPTETGRFLLASCLSGLSSEHSVEAGGGLRGLRVYGPRAVFLERFAATSIGQAELRVPIAFSGVRSPVADAGRRQDLVDRLYEWAMATVGAIGGGAGAAGGALAEVVALTGGVPEAGCAPENEHGDGYAGIVDAGEVMTQALAACVSRAGGEVTITQLMLEAALRGGVGAEFTPERVGRWLTSSGALDPAAPNTRRRLHGHIARIYTLALADGEVRTGPDPLAFCAATRCGECRYRSVCATVVPGLMTRKTSRG